MLLAGLVVRILFMGQNGFANDVSSFEAWAIGLSSHPMWQFYSSTTFADYPPGYFYVLWVVGHVWALVSHANLDLLKYLVKVPAVLCDLGVASLIFAIVRRFSSEKWAFAAAAIFIFNPAVIFISASWGQVDSVSSGLALLAVYWLLRSEDVETSGAPALQYTTGAWLALAFSLLIKPQAAVLVPLFIAFAFAKPAFCGQRLTAAGISIVAAIAFVFVLTLPFHPAADAFVWLYDKYNYGKNVYPFNSVNAFNLWSIIHSFWQPDKDPIVFLPQYIWGVVLLAAACILSIVRYLQGRTQRAFVEAAVVMALAFFMLSTRMHERYIYDGLVFTIVSIPFARRYLIAALIFSFTLFVNLFYSLDYLTAVNGGAPGVNAADMWPYITHPLSLLNVATFFVLGYIFLGAQDESEERETPSWLKPGGWLTARSWFNPREGLGAMVWPLDYAMAAGLSVVSFVVSFVNYWLPEKTDQCWQVLKVTNCGVFDEIYFARAGEEYIHGQYIYENTHPPLTKLIIAFSTILFGDNTHGWRLMDVLFGAIAIAVIYAFAKRLTRSTLFSSFAAIMFIADGMHFVQSRIATPEGIVVVFALGALYAFYRFWIASQSAIRNNEPNPGLRCAIALGAALILGFGTSAAINAFMGPSTASEITFGLFFTSGWYLFMRLVAVPRWFMPPEGTFISYADGTVAFRGAPNSGMFTPDGRNVTKDIVVKTDESTLTYKRDGTMAYATPDGSAVYSPGVVVDDDNEEEEGKHATTWLIVFTVLLGALVASKWYGVMAYPVSLVVITLVWLQRWILQYMRPPAIALYGNPYGFRLDVSVAAIAFLSMSVYLCAWIPDLIRVLPNHEAGGLNSFKDLILRQYTMFQYHDTLKATHPYQSAWWQWPLDLRPIAYYWHDTRAVALQQTANACCVSEIISLPNPLILWLGLVTVPVVACLAWRERNKGYALLVFAYLLQWLPWARSPRITFAYHFYVDIPIIILCNVIVLQRLWEMVRDEGEARILTRIAIGGYVALVVLAFIWFYPILSAQPLPWNLWHARMWTPLMGNDWI